MRPRVVGLAMGLLSLTMTMWATHAVAGMRRPVPLATQVGKADAVVLGTVTTVDVHETDAIRTITLAVDVQDSLPGHAATGQLQVRVVQDGLGTTGDFGSHYAVTETRLFVLKRASDGVFEQQLYVAPTLSSTAPASPHPLARGARWLVLPDWNYGGVQFPLELPLTFANASGARDCHDDELKTFVAWFTWEDLLAVPWSDVDAKRAQVGPATPCAPYEDIPVAVRCSPETCPPDWWNHDVIDCRGAAGAVRLTRAGADTFGVRGSLRARRLPRRLRATIDDHDRALRLAVDGPDGREVLRIHRPWYTVVAVVSPTGGTPPPPPRLHVAASLPRRASDDGLSLVCTAR